MPLVHSTLLMPHSLHGHQEFAGLRTLKANWSNLTVGAGQEFCAAERVGEANILEGEHVRDRPPPVMLFRLNFVSFTGFIAN